MSVRWQTDHCEACGTPMESDLILVTEATRLIGDTIGIKSPPLAKVCNKTCLAKWLGVQVRLLPSSTLLAHMLDEEIGAIFADHIVVATLFDDERLLALATRLRARLQA